ncbi:unnamed protein product [Prunus armeniaca]
MLISSDEEEAQVEQIEQDAESDGFEEEEEHQHHSPVRNQVEFRFNQYKVNYALNSSQGDPTTYREAIASDERDSWISAMT